MVVVRISSMIYEFDEPYLEVIISWSPYGGRMSSGGLKGPTDEFQGAIGGRHVRQSEDTVRCHR
jgi:hypothetical protein